MDLNITKSLRDQFLLKPDVIYFNHGSFGATPKPVFESYQRWQRELELQPTEFFGRKSPGLLVKSREALAKFLHTSSQNLAFVTNTTTGLNVIVNSLQLKPGDEILATNHEYGAMERTWKFHADKRGYKYINQPIPVPVISTDNVVSQLWLGVTEHTRVIFISHITSPTGLIFPMKEIAEKAHKQGIYVVVDGAHAPGQIVLNLDELGVDFYTGNLHKWLCAPKGTAFIFVRPELQHLIQPLIISWGWLGQNSDAGHFAEFIEMQGTRDLSAFLAVPDAIRFFNDHDWPAQQVRCHSVLKEIILRISHMTNLEPLSPLSSQWFSQMTSVPIPQNLNCSEVHTRLLEDFHIEIPVPEWNSRKLIRISFQGYNSIEDANALVNALQLIFDV